MQYEIFSQLMNEPHLRLDLVSPLLWRTAWRDLEKTCHQSIERVTWLMRDRTKLVARLKKFKDKLQIEVIQVEDDIPRFVVGDIIYK